MFLPLESFPVSYFNFLAASLSSDICFTVSATLADLEFEQAPPIFFLKKFN